MRVLQALCGALPLLAGVRASPLAFPAERDSNLPSIETPNTSIPSSSSPTAAPAPTVTLSYGTFAGSTSNGIDSWLGVPHAQPPVGNLRLRQALPPLNYAGVQNATAYGQGCPQIPLQAGLGSPLIPANLTTPYFPAAAKNLGGEDCLYANIIRPSGTTSTSGLPVLLVSGAVFFCSESGDSSTQLQYIHGGGFQFGQANQQYDGTPIVARSVATGNPIIYVIANYRLNGFGFLAGKQIVDAGLGNLGLKDQQHFLDWGESVGAISTGFHMTNSPNISAPLFRAAWANSGSPLAVGPVAGRSDQTAYDFIAKRLGCFDAVDGLECLRGVNYTDYKLAVDSVPGADASSWVPHIDGGFFDAGNPVDLVREGHYTTVPLVTGNLKDEGTLWGLFSLNITTPEESLNYLHTNYLPGATPAEIARLDVLYPADPTVGCPYDTGLRNQLTSQFKRISSATGDMLFQSNRRNFLAKASATQPCWSFLYSKGNQGTPFMGAFHTSDTTRNWFLPKIGAVDYSGIDYLVNFVVHLDPNGNTASDTLFQWPQYTLGTKQLLDFGEVPVGGLHGLSLIVDDYRSEGIQFWIDMWKKYNIW
ncbi:hypothetical protein RQP46_010909 [Phenoliferia psychrophenolica]